MKRSKRRICTYGTILFHIEGAHRLWGILDPSVWISRLVHSNDAIHVAVVEPEDGIESRGLNDTHVAANAEGGVKTIMKCLKVANASTIRFVGDLLEWLVCCQEFVKHVPKVRLLLANTLIHLVISARSVGHESVFRVTYGMIPVFELKFTLCRCQLRTTAGPFAHFTKTEKSSDFRGWKS